MEHETEHLVQASTENKNAWCHTTVPIRLNGVVLNYIRRHLYLYLNFASVMSTAVFLYEKKSPLSNSFCTRKLQY
jgi:hypothetical protein